MGAKYVQWGCDSSERDVACVDVIDQKHVVTHLNVPTVMHHVLHVLFAACWHDWCNYFNCLHSWRRGLDFCSLLLFLTGRHICYDETTSWSSNGGRYWTQLARQVGSRCEKSNSR